MLVSAQRVGCSVVFFDRMKLTAAAGFTRRFGIGLRAGADLIQLIKAEAKHGSSKHRTALAMLADRAAKGEQLSTSMRQYGKYFPPLMVAMTAVGESTGRLERTMLEMADHYENQVSLRRSFVSAITMPSLQLFAGLGVISLLIWIMGLIQTPGGGQIMDILGLGLRGPEGVMKFWAIIGVLLLLVFAALWGFSRNVCGVQNLIPLLYMIPVVGPALQTITLSRFAWSLSMGLDAGLDPIRGISLALDSTASDYYRGSADRAESSIRKGATLSQSLEATDLFPDEFLSRIEVSELSGTDAESIGGLAKEYDERAKMAMRALAKMASGTVWITMIFVLLFFLIRMIINVFGSYAAAIQDASNI